ncbi:DUF6262 family protein [Nodosilinea sp. FACHB-13]|uniref:DUF6262 family protein n=1 Tax=Cyanophyceae TaxID=3028117 RepID=UPI001688E7CE|nr:DUF6262 family protein [Nodosilinea sp. FACHB-13]MBD2107281.1 hypothetical protein [Nodosilinea sp. FACHB-13]
MAVERSVDGLRRSAQRKHQEALEKVEKGIQSLVKDKRPINFNTVAEAAGVSKAWLYKEADVKARIEQLRAQSSGSKKQPPVNQRASDASKDALLRTMKERIKRLEAENKDLRRQNEVAYSHVLKARDLEKEVQRLNAHVERLQQKMHLNSADATPPEPKSIQLALADLGVEMNSTLVRLITETPVGILETAIEALKEALAKGPVRSPGGFFHSAVRDCWRPNEVYQEKADMEEFNQWWKWAYDKGLVRAAMQQDGTQFVLSADGEWYSFEEITRQYPLGS